VFELLSWHFPEGTEKNAEKFVRGLGICAEAQTGYPHHDHWTNPHGLW